MIIPKFSRYGIAVSALAVLTASLVLPFQVQAIPARPGLFEAYQPDGSAIQLGVRGDEWYNWLEDADGYTVTRTAAGLYVYAQSGPNKNLVPTNLIVGKHDPAMMGLQKGVRPAKTSKEQKLAQRQAYWNSPGGQAELDQYAREFEAARAIRELNGPVETLSLNKAKPVGRTVFTHLVLLAVFRDHYDPDDPAFIGNFTGDPVDYDFLFNQLNASVPPAQTGSVRDYFLYNSDNEFDVQSFILPLWLKLPDNEIDYSGTDGSGSEFADLMVMDSLIRAAQFVDFNDYTFLTVVHSGYDAAAGADGAIWSHAGPLPQGPWPYGGYMTVPAFHGTAGTNLLRLGVTVHELGHSMFGLPDLYDTDEPPEEVNSGSGNWCLMAGGSWGWTADQFNPSHLCAWSRLAAGFDFPTLLPDFEDWGTFDIASWPERIDNDSSLPTMFGIILESQGLAVNHVATGRELVNEILHPEIYLPGDNPPNDMIDRNEFSINSASLGGEAFSHGTFRNGIQSGLPIDRGVVLSTGNIYDAPGENSSDVMETFWNTPGDDDLNILFWGSDQDVPGDLTADASSLEFSFTILNESLDTGTVYLDVVFVSEEYQDAVMNPDPTVATVPSDGFAIVVDGNVIETVEDTIVFHTPIPDPLEAIQDPNRLNAFTAPEVNLEFDGIGHFMTLEIDLRQELPVIADPNAPTDPNAPPGPDPIPDPNAPPDPDPVPDPNAYEPGQPHTIKIVIADRELGDHPFLSNYRYDSALFIQTNSFRLQRDIDLVMPDSFTEFLLIENRQPGGFETTLPQGQGGIAVWHIDNDKGFGNNTEEGHPGQPDWPGNGLHHAVALLQADGLFELEQGIGQGDAGDLYRGDPGGATRLNRCTVPGTNRYQSGFDAPTHIGIFDISPSAPIMTFNAYNRAFFNDDCSTAISINEQGAFNFETMSYEVLGTNFCGLETYRAVPLSDLNDPLRQPYAGACVGYDLSDPYVPEFPTYEAIDPFDAWYSYRRDESGFIKIGLQSDFDTTLEYFNDCSVLTSGQAADPSNSLSIRCSDDTEFDPQTEFFQAEDFVYLVGGVDYLVRIAGYNRTEGDFTLTLTEEVFVELGNDDWPFALELTEGIPSLGSTVGATPAVVDPPVDITPGAVEDDADVWYRFTPDRDGELQLRLCSNDPAPVPFFKPNLAVYADPNNLAGSLRAYSDDCDTGVCTGCLGGGVSLSLDAQNGVTYYIRVAGLEFTFGEFEIAAGIVPANDECDNAIAVADADFYTDFVLPGTSIGSTPSFPSSSNPDHTCSIDESDLRDVWYRYMPIVNGPVTVSLCSADFDTTLSIYTDCGTTRIACNDDHGFDPNCGPGGLGSELTFDAMAFETYLIRVSGYDNTVGLFSMEVHGGRGSDMAVLPPYAFELNLGVALNHCLEAVGGALPYTGWTVANLPEDYVVTDLGSSQFNASSGQAQGWRSNNQLWTYDLPFTFRYLTESVTQIKVSSNGFLELGDSTLTSPSNTPDLLANNKRIAPLWDNLRTDQQPADDIYIDQSHPDRVTIRWQGETFGTANPVNVSVTLFENGTIQFDYGSGNAQVTPTVGISNGAGQVITVPGYDSFDAPVSLSNANSFQIAVPDNANELPTGLSLDAGGCISGTPTELGTWQMRVSVSDSQTIPGPGIAFQELSFIVGLGGDLSGDTAVNYLDIAEFSGHWTRTDCSAANGYCDRADINRDGVVDLSDINVMLINWLFSAI